MKTYMAALAALLTAVAALAADPKADADKSYDTPQAVFDAASAAQKKGAFKTFAACLSPEAQSRGPRAWRSAPSTSSRPPTPTPRSRSSSS